MAIDLVLVVDNTGTATKLQVDGVAILESEHRAHKTIADTTGNGSALMSIATEEQRVFAIGGIDTTIPGERLVLDPAAANGDSLVPDVRVLRQAITNLAGSPVLTALKAHLENIVHHARVIGMAGLPVVFDIQAHSPTVPVGVADVKFCTNIRQEQSPIDHIGAYRQPIKDAKGIDTGYGNRYHLVDRSETTFFLYLFPLPVLRSISW